MTLPFTDPVLVFATVMVLVLIAPLVARWAKLPENVGLIIAGIIVGPYGLGILGRDQDIRLLGSIGLLFIMFLAGLEIDMHQVRRHKSHTIIFGLLTFIIPLVLGTALGLAVFGMGMAGSILLASMFSSHTLVTFPIVGKLGLTRTRSVTTTIGGTMVTLVLSLLILAVIARGHDGSLSPAFWIRTLIIMALYVAGVIILMPLAGRWFLRTMNADENFEYVFVIAVTFLGSYLAYAAGLEPIIGAFLAGVAFNSLIPEKSLLMTRIHFTGDSMFIPFFLLSVGMLVDLRQFIIGGSAWLFSAGMIVVALLAKYLAAEITGWILGYRKDERHLVFGLSVNQAAATLAAVLVGYNIGLFSDAVISGTITMIAVTCLAGSIITERAGRKVSLHEEQTTCDPASAPHRIMVPLGDVNDARDLLDIAFLLRERDSLEPIYPMRAVLEKDDADFMVAAAERVLAKSTVRIIDAGIPVVPLTCVDVNVSSGVLRLVKDHRISTLILAWDGRPGFRTHVFGRTIDTIVEQSSQMVMVNRISRPVNTAKRMLVVLPPFAHREVGFDLFLGAIKILSSQASVMVTMLGTDQTLSISRSFTEKGPNPLHATYTSFDTWKGIVETISAMVDENDWVVVMGTRKGEIAWQPFSDRIPGRLVRTLPLNSLSVLVTPIERPKLVIPATTPRSAPSIPFDPRRTLLNASARTVEELLRDLLASHFDKNASYSRELHAQLFAISQSQPVELCEGAVLLHTYVRWVKKTTIFLGVTQHTLDITGTGKPVYALIVVLEPESLDPERHLQVLAEIARYVRLPDMPERLRESRNFDDLRVS